MAATYTVKQVASILGYSTNSIYSFLKEKRIKGVRVGTGRFRIPQSELNRLLLLSKKETQITQAPSDEQRGPRDVSASGIIEPIHAHGINPMGREHATRVEVPSLFDWFVGLGAIIIGLSAFLFNRSHEEFGIDAVAMWIPAIRVSLLAAGSGLLLTDVMGVASGIWHKFFHLVLVAAFAAFAGVLAQTGDSMALVIFGSVSSVMALSFFLPLGGIAGFTMVIGAVMVFVPVIWIHTSGDVLLQVPYLSESSPFTLSLSWIVASIAFTALLIWGYLRNRFAFWVGVTVTSIALVGMSLAFARDLHWGRALYLLLMALTAMFLPSWDGLQFTHKQDRKLVFTAFGSLLLVFCVVIWVVRIVQTNIIVFTQAELGSKVSFARSLTENTLQAATMAVEGLAKNAQMIAELSKRKPGDTVTLIRATFEGSQTLRRVLVLTAAGELLGSYPLDETLEARNYAVRDYFFNALTGGRTYFSELMVAPGEERPSIAIATPVLDKDGESVGVIVGVFDVDKLGNNLQQIVNPLNGEYVVVVDKTGKILVHPDRKRIGGAAEVGDHVLLGTTGDRGSSRGITDTGKKSLVSYDSIVNRNWGIAVIAPVVELMRLGSIGTITIFSVIGISVLILIGFNLTRKVRHNIPFDSS